MRLRFRLRGLAGPLQFHFYENDTCELYNLSNDLGESQSLILSETNRTATLSRTLIRLLEALGANYPRSLANAPLRPTPLVAPGTDADGDKLLDAPEDTNNDGLLDPAETDPDDLDTDRDRTPDGAERAIGTDPRNAASGFRLRINPNGPDQIQFDWPSLPGASVRLERKGQLHEPWSPVQSGIAADFGTNTSRMFALHATNEYFRVQLEGF